MTGGDSTHGRIIITIDGPAGTGKSTVALSLARRLGLDFLDTGAMYRAAALIALEQKIDPTDGHAVSTATQALDLHFDFSIDPPPIMLGDRNVSDRVRDLDVSDVVSIVAAQRELRRVLVKRQRKIAEAHPRLVTEGRDQGSTVFPDATLRFYLDADPGIRARRRLEQLRESGRVADLERIVEDIRRRDELDSNRADGPLVCPEGAIRVDTATRSVEEVVLELETVARDRIAAEELSP